MTPDLITLDRLTPEASYRALQTRDSRFDGRLFVGVTSTGVYCRPVCPARTPLFAHCRFFLSAAAAQTEGFRPCLRCRPETAPGLGCWRGTSNSVSRALALIAEGALDGDEGVERLAARLGLGERQLRRLFQKHLGASPIAVAQTRRVLFAKQLLHETRMPVAQVALAAGFGSVRRCNETFNALFHRPPTSLRRKQSRSDAQAPVTLYLRYRAPYDWDAMLRHVAARALDGCENVESGVYRRAFEAGEVPGVLEVGFVPARQSLKVTVRLPGLPHAQTLPAIVARIRRLFDLDADTAAIESHLSRDPDLAALISRRPGLRVAGAWDPFELAVRAVLGQQVTVEAGRQLGTRLVALYGQKLERRDGTDLRLTHLFPPPHVLAEAPLDSIGMPASRRRTLVCLAAAALAESDLFDGRVTGETIARLQEVPGIGRWTAQYIALRAFRDPDAFPDSDVGLLRAMSRLTGLRVNSVALLRRAERWRPWRAYAAQHLWTSGAMHV